MNDQSYFSLVAAAVLGIVLVLGATALLVTPSTPASPPTAGTGVPGPTVYRTLTVTYVPSTGQFSYNVVNLQVPLHTRVVFTIANYDPSMGGLPSSADANVSGTMGGMMQVSSMGAGTTLGSIPYSQVSHTFSMSNAYYHLNVPVPRAPGDGTPATVTFSAVFNDPGTFGWGCVVLCGPSDMSAPDMMFGTLTVG
jgi:hypothetical protein